MEAIMNLFNFYKILISIAFFLIAGNCNNLPLNQTSDYQKHVRQTGALFAINSIVKSNSYNWNLPATFPTPKVSIENPMTNEKVELGRFLFYDKKLSANQTQSCGSCHIQEFAFSDRKPVGIGSTGEAHTRNSQNLANVAYNTRLTWANNKMTSLETQIRGPMFGTTPIELGLTTDSYIDRFKADSRYKELFSKAFGGGTENINEQNIRFAVSSFQRSMISGKSKVDRYLNYGDKSALSASALRGMSIFNTEVGDCFHCHGGFNYTDTVSYVGGNDDTFYNNNGIKSVAEYALLQDNQKGLYDVTKNPSDEGKFKAPSLRNIALTYPYMHDGSFTCTTASPDDVESCSTEALGKVVDHYSSGGKSHPNKNSQFIRPLSLSPQEKTDLVNFLKSLTDDEFIKNPKFSDPFK